MPPTYYTCILCTSGRGQPEAWCYHHETPWVGTYDAGDLLGECPRCHMGSYGIVPLADLEDGDFDRDAALQAIAAGEVDHLDPETTEEEPPGLADTLDEERERDFAEDLADARDDRERARLLWNRGGE